MPLTERQQLAFLLEMTAKEEAEKNESKRVEEDAEAKKPGTSSKSPLSKIDKRNKRGETQLHLAAIKGDIEVVKSLIKRGADVNVTDHAGHEYQEICEILKTDHNINLSLSQLKRKLEQYDLRRNKVEYNRQSLRYSIMEILDGPGSSWGYRSVQHALQRQGIRVPRKAVEEIVRELDPDGVETRVISCVGVNTSALGQMKFGMLMGWTPLHEACSRGFYKIVKRLLKAGADPNAKGLENDTPLHDASSNDHVKTLQILLKYGGDPTKRNDDLETALDLAASSVVSDILEEFCSLSDVGKECYGSNNDFLSDTTIEDDDDEIMEKMSEQGSDFESRPPSLFSDTCGSHTTEKNVTDSEELTNPEASSRIPPEKADEEKAPSDSNEDEEVIFKQRKKRSSAKLFSQISSDQENYSDAETSVSKHYKKDVRDKEVSRKGKRGMVSGKKGDSEIFKEARGERRRSQKKSRKDLNDAEKCSDISVDDKINLEGFGKSTEKARSSPQNKGEFSHTEGKSSSARNDKDTFHDESDGNDDNEVALLKARTIQKSDEKRREKEGDEGEKEELVTDIKGSRQKRVRKKRSKPGLSETDGVEENVDRESGQYNEKKSLEKKRKFVRKEIAERYDKEAGAESKEQKAKRKTTRADKKKILLTEKVTDDKADVPDFIETKKEGKELEKLSFGTGDVERQNKEKKEAHSKQDMALEHTETEKYDDLSADDSSSELIVPKKKKHLEVAGEDDTLSRKKEAKKEKTESNSRKQHPELENKGSKQNASIKHRTKNDRKRKKSENDHGNILDSRKKPKGDEESSSLRSPVRDSEETVLTRKSEEMKSHDDSSKKLSLRHEDVDICADRDVLALSSDSESPDDNMCLMDLVNKKSSSENVIRDDSTTEHQKTTIFKKHQHQQHSSAATTIPKQQQQHNSSVATATTTTAITKQQEQQHHSSVANQPTKLTIEKQQQQQNETTATTTKSIEKQQQQHTTTATTKKKQRQDITAARTTASKQQKQQEAAKREKRVLKAKECGPLIESDSMTEKGQSKTSSLPEKHSQETIPILKKASSSKNSLGSGDNVIKYSPTLTDFSAKIMPVLEKQGIPTDRRYIEESSSNDISILKENTLTRSPVSTENTPQIPGSFNDNPYISDISDAENIEEDEACQERMTSDMFRVNIFNRVLNQNSDDSSSSGSSAMKIQQSSACDDNGMSKNSGEKGVYPLETKESDTAGKSLEHATLDISGSMAKKIRVSPGQEFETDAKSLTSRNLTFSNHELFAKETKPIRSCEIADSENSGFISKAVIGGSEKRKAEHDIEYPTASSVRSEIGKETSKDSKFKSERSKHESKSTSRFEIRSQDSRSFHEANETIKESVSSSKSDNSNFEKGYICSAPVAETQHINDKSNATLISQAEHDSASSSGMKPESKNTLKSIASSIGSNIDASVRKTEAVQNDARFPGDILQQKKDTCMASSLFPEDGKDLIKVKKDASRVTDKAKVKRSKPKTASVKDISANNSDIKSAKKSSESRDFIDVVLDVPFKKTKSKKFKTSKMTLSKDKRTRSSDIPVASKSSKNNDEISGMKDISTSSGNKIKTKTSKKVSSKNVSKLSAEPSRSHDGKNKFGISKVAEKLAAKSGEQSEKTAIASKSSVMSPDNILTSSGDRFSASSDDSRMSKVNIKIENKTDESTLSLEKPLWETDERFKVVQPGGLKIDPKCGEERKENLKGKTNVKLSPVAPIISVKPETENIPESDDKIEPASLIHGNIFDSFPDFRLRHRDSEIDSKKLAAPMSKGVTDSKDVTACGDSRTPTNISTAAHVDTGSFICDNAGVSTNPNVVSDVSMAKDSAYGTMKGNTTGMTDSRNMDRMIAAPYKSSGSNSANTTEQDADSVVIRDATAATSGKHLAMTNTQNNKNRKLIPIKNTDAAKYVDSSETKGGFANRPLDADRQTVTNTEITRDIHSSIEESTETDIAEYSNTAEINEAATTRHDTRVVSNASTDAKINSGHIIDSGTASRIEPAKVDDVNTTRFSESGEGIEASHAKCSSPEMVIESGVVAGKTDVLPITPVNTSSTKNDATQNVLTTTKAIEHGNSRTFADTKPVTDIDTRSIIDIKNVGGFGDDSANTTRYDDDTNTATCSDFKLANDATSMNSPVHDKEIDMKIESMNISNDSEKRFKPADTYLSIADVRKPGIDDLASRNVDPDSIAKPVKGKQQISLEKVAASNFGNSESLKNADEDLMAKDLCVDDHLGPFHGTKFEESDADLKELSHPEDTLKRLLTEGVPDGGNDKDVRDSSNDKKDAGLPVVSLPVTGLPEAGISVAGLSVPDLSVLPQAMTDSIAQLRRTYLTELSEEDRHIVNMSMEIAENLNNSDICADEDDNIIRDALKKDTMTENIGTKEVEHDRTNLQSKPFEKINLDSSLSSLDVSQVKSTNELPITSSCIKNETLKDEPVTDSKMMNSKPGITTETYSKNRKQESSLPLSISSSNQITASPGRPPNKTRSVNIEPRGIPPVVADIDLHPILPCDPSSIIPPIIPISTQRPVSSTSINTANSNAINNNDNNVENKMKEKSDSESKSGDSGKSDLPSNEKNSRPMRSGSPNYPSAWREKLFRNHIVLKPKIPSSYRSFAVLTGRYHLRDSEESAVQDDVVDEIKEMKEEHVVELEKLHLNMEQELLRVESKVQLASNNNKPISACSTVMHQKLEQYAKLGVNSRCNSQPNPDPPDINNLRKGWIQEVLDRFIKLEERIITRQKNELGCLEQQISFNEMHALGRKEILRRKYFDR